MCKGFVSLYVEALRYNQAVYIYILSNVWRDLE